MRKSPVAASTAAGLFFGERILDLMGRKISYGTLVDFC